MLHRIRSGAIIVNEKNQILLLHNRSSWTGKDYYCPPGGGLDEGENVINNAVRETLEETGLKIEVGKLIYFAEFVSRRYNNINLELYFLATKHSGEIKWDHPNADQVIEEVAWFTQAELQNKSLFPAILKNEFWNDLAAGFPQVKYLGQTSDDFHF